jgi:hypothetical protein
MTEIQGSPVSGRHDAGLLLEDLACMCGTLSEIMTAWRRVMPWRPELPIGCLTALQDTARQLAADIAAADSAAAVGAGRHPDPSVAARFSTLKEAIAAARATTLAPGTAEIGDRGLWELLGAAMQRAETQLADPPDRASPSTADVCIRSPVLPSS